MKKGLEISVDVSTAMQMIDDGHAKFTNSEDEERIAVKVKGVKKISALAKTENTKRSNRKQKAIDDQAKLDAEAKAKAIEEAEKAELKKAEEEAEEEAEKKKKEEEAKAEAEAKAKADADAKK